MLFSFSFWWMDVSLRSTFLLKRKAIMADTYIDYFEVEEYGSHFCREAKSLIGKYAAVDVTILVSDVQTSLNIVNIELEKAGLQRSALRTNQGGAEEATTEARNVLTRFSSFLGSLDPKESPFDLKAFFPSGNLGNISQLKADDVKARAKQALSGFEIELNKKNTDLEPWKKRIATAHETLTAALDGKGQQRTGVGAVTASLQKARLDFLDTYNGVAKPIIRGLLNKLSRSEDFKTFFKDLQVNETTKAPTTPSETGSGTPA
jgi:hypothetical protein